MGRNKSKMAYRLDFSRLSEIRDCLEAVSFHFQEQDFKAVEITMYSRIWERRNNKFNINIDINKERC